MPSLRFEIAAVEPVLRSLTPLLHFKLRITNSLPDEQIQAILLTAQIQIQSPQRSYSAAEKEKLFELFGPPEIWGQTLRNRLWVHASTTVAPFKGKTETVLAVPCSGDLSVAATKYFYALEGGDVSLLFLFSGSIFYLDAGRLQIAPISWSEESVFRIPVATWQSLIEQHYPNTSWLSLRRDIFERLYAHKRRHSLITWEDTIEHLLQTWEESLSSVGPELERVNASV